MTARGFLAQGSSSSQLGGQIAKFSVSFNTAFASPPGVIATPSGAKRFADVLDVTTTSVEIHVYGVDAKFSDAGFHFVAVGEPA